MPYPTIKLTQIQKLKREDENLDNYGQWSQNYIKTHSEIRYKQLNSEGQIEFLKFFKKESPIQSLRKDSITYAQLHEAMLYLNGVVAELGGGSTGLNKWMHHKLAQKVYWIIVRKAPLSPYQMSKIAEYIAPKGTHNQLMNLLTNLGL